MLLEDLGKVIEAMKEIQNMEQDFQDFQKQSRMDHLYAAEVENSNKLVDCIENTREFVNFIPSLLLKEQLLQLLKDSQKLVETGLVSEVRLKDLQNSTKKIRKDYETEWNIFYKNISDKRLHMLAAIKEITHDKNKTGYAINKIKNASVIIDENYNKKIRQLAEGISEADNIFKELELDKEKEIMIFLDKVAEGKATIFDLTDSIRKWIGERNLDDKFVITFWS